MSEPAPALDPSRLEEDALEALREGDASRADSLARASIRPRLVARLEAEVSASELADLLSGAELFARYLPERLEAALSGGAGARGAERPALALARAALGTDPARARALLERILDDAQTRDLAGAADAYGREAGDALLILAALDPQAAKLRAAPLRGRRLPPDTAERLAAATLAWDPAEGLDGLARANAKDRLPAAAGRVANRWLRAPLPPTAPWDLTPLFAALDAPRQRFVLERLLLKLLFASVEVEPKPLAAFLVEVDPEAAAGARPWVEVAAALAPPRLAEICRILPDERLVRIAGPAIARAEAAGSEGPERAARPALVKLGLAERFPGEVGPARVTAALLCGRVEEALSVASGLPRERAFGPTYRAVVNASWREERPLALLALDFLKETVAAVAPVDRGLAKALLLEVHGLGELDPDLAAEVVAGLEPDDAALLLEPGFTAMFGAKLMGPVLGKVGPRSAPALFARRIALAGRLDEGGRRLIEIAARDDASLAECMRTLGRYEPEVAWQRAKQARPEQRTALLYAAAEGEVEARAQDARIGILERAVAARDMVSLRTALSLVAGEAGVDGIGEVRFDRVLAALERMADIEVASVEPYLLLAFGDGGRLVHPELRGRYGKLRRRALAVPPGTPLFDQPLRRTAAPRVQEAETRRSAAIEAAAIEAEAIQAAAIEAAAIEAAAIQAAASGPAPAPPPPGSTETVKIASRRALAAGAGAAHTSAGAGAAAAGVGSGSVAGPLVGAGAGVGAPPAPVPAPAPGPALAGGVAGRQGGLFDRATKWLDGVLGVPPAGARAELDEPGAAGAAAPGGRPRPRISVTLGDPIAELLRESLAGGDWRDASEYLRTCRDPDEREFLVDSITRWAGRPAFFDEWVRKAREDPAAWLVRGFHSVRWAWEARGSGVAANVEEDAWPVFMKRLAAAEEDLRRAVELDPRDSMPYVAMLVTARGLDLPIAEAEARFAEVVGRNPGSLLGHEHMLIRYCEKWGGSHDLMFGFARQASKAAPEGSLIPGLVALAHIERWLFADADLYFKDPTVRGEVIAAYGRSIGARGHTERRESPRVRQWFAFCFHRMGQMNLARRELERIGPHVVEVPWAYLGKDAVRAFIGVRDEVAAAE